MADLTLEERVAKLEEQVANFKNKIIPKLQDLAQAVKKQLADKIETDSKDAEKQRRKSARRR